MKPNPNAETLEQMIRVDHAGEYGANRIYEGQLMLLGHSEIGGKLRYMLLQEQAHLQKFEELINRHKVRPSALMPLWHIGGLALGVVSAMLGKKAAMACTVAIEEAIDEHYFEQYANLDAGELKDVVAKFRQEELEHRDTGIANNAEQMFGYEAFKSIIKLGAKTSIWLAKRL